jgi:hypothetical protein
MTIYVPLLYISVQTKFLLFLDFLHAGQQDGEEAA